MKKMHTLVIGGTKGIGKVVAEAFAKEGHEVSIIGRKKPEDNIKNASYWALDLENPELIKKILDGIIKKNGRLNNIIFLQRYRGDGDEWQGEIDTSLTATKTVIEGLSDKFAASGDKSIALISSLASDFAFKEQEVAYHVAKAGLNRMASYYAVKLAPKGIRVNCVSPSTVLKEESKDFYNKNKKLYEIYKKITPLGRMCTPDDVAAAILFLCSSSASFITGHNLVVDGGLSLQSQESIAREISSLGNLSMTQRKSD